MSSKRQQKVRALKISDLKNLAGVDMRHLYLSFADFANMNLRHTNFEGCRLNCGVLDGSDLTGANLKNTDLRHASFRGATLEGALFGNTIAVDANFEDAEGLSDETKEYLKSRGAHGL